MIKINQLKEIEILSACFKITWDKSTDGGYFSWSDSSITIGTKSIKKDSLYTFSVISHEIMEVILTGIGVRFESSRTASNYLFNFDHQTFENAIQIHAQIISKFIKQ